MSGGRKDQAVWRREGSNWRDAGPPLALDHETRPLMAHRLQPLHCWAVRQYALRGGVPLHQGLGS